MWATPENDAAEWLPVLDLPEPGPQRRLTVLLRMLLLIPQYVVLWLLRIAAIVVTVIGWFAALVTGHLPAFAERFLADFLAYDTRVNAYLMLLEDRYPPFALRSRVDYPVQIEVRPGQLNRLAVFFRLILAIPAAIVEAVAAAGWWVLAFISWVVVLVLGRMPRPLFEATAAIVRYSMRYEAYMMMLTSAYPKRLFGDGGPPVGPVAERGPSATRPLLVSSGGMALLVLFVVAGVLSYASSSVTTMVTNDNTNDSTAAQPR